MDTLQIAFKSRHESAQKYYLNEAISQRWSTRALERQINTLSYERLTVDKNSSNYLKRIDSLFGKNKPAMIKCVDQEEERLKREITVNRNYIDSVKVKQKTNNMKKVIRK